jgi:cytidyltransferase-like protein
MKNSPNKTVMVFGVFDGLHEGHFHFLNEAKKHGQKLIAVIAHDQAAFRLKNRPPKMSLPDRILAISQHKAITEAVPGDNTEGIWEVIWKYKPDVIALGYDQERLREALLRDQGMFSWPIEFVVINSHKPDEFHSSLLS